MELAGSTAVLVNPTQEVRACTCAPFLDEVPNMATALTSHKTGCHCGTFSSLQKAGKLPI